MNKRAVIMVFCILLGVMIVSAQAGQIKVDIFPVDKQSFKPGENITLKVSVYDSQNLLVNGKVLLILESADKTQRIEKEISTNTLEDINLGKNSTAGPWQITAIYSEGGAIIESPKQFIDITGNELAHFELVGDSLVITNIGNIKYSKKVTILIGDSVGSKEVDLGVGEKIDFRLLAPQGTYRIMVSDGISDSITRSDVALTGNVIGILDKKLAGTSSLASGVNPSKDSGIYSSLQNKSFVYVFVIAVLGITILLAIERRYRKKISR